MSDSDVTGIADDAPIAAISQVLDPADEHVARQGPPARADGVGDVVDVFPAVDLHAVALVALAVVVGDIATTPLLGIVATIAQCYLQQLKTVLCFRPYQLGECKSLPCHHRPLSVARNLFSRPRIRI